jgi:hypothetical protein
MGTRTILHPPPYAGEVAANIWRIIIPITGKLTPITLLSRDFRSKTEAEEWLASDAGQTLVTYVCENRALPS